MKSEQFGLHYVVVGNRESVGTFDMNTCAIQPRLAPFNMCFETQFGSPVDEDFVFHRHPILPERPRFVKLLPGGQ